jgi:capsid portal protein
VKVTEEAVSSAVEVGEYGQSKLMAIFSIEELEEKEERRSKQLEEYTEAFNKWKTGKGKSKAIKENGIRRGVDKSFYTPGDPPFPGADVLTSDIMSILASNEYWEKPYEQERLARLAEISSPLKANIITYARNTVGLDIEYVPSKRRKLHEFTPEELAEYHKQGKDMLNWMDEKTDIGLRFCGVSKQHVGGKIGIGEGYLEVIRNRDGEIDSIHFVSAQYIFVRRSGDGYIHTKSGTKMYYKKFGDLNRRNKYTFEKGGSLEDSATELIPYKEMCEISSIYGVPGWTPNIPNILGSRYADERNVNFFLNDAPQPLDAKILTPYGWSTMGDMEIGSEVIGSDGKAHKVTGVFPQGQKDVYKIKFFDDSETECTLGHIWTVTNNYDRQRGVTRNMTLKELIDDGFFYESKGAKWAIPMTDPVEYQKGKPLPIDAYLMGLLLGDGCLISNGISLATFGADTDETMTEITPLLPKDIHLTRRDRRREDGKVLSKKVFCSEEGDPQRTSSELGFRRNKGKYHNEMIKLIRELNLLGVKAFDKFIPEMYLRASVKDRVSLLQGLMDSDGTIGDTSSDSAVRYVTVSIKLAKGIQELVGSLGGTVTIRPVKGQQTLQLIIRQLPKWIIPVRLSRKVKQYTPSTALRWRTMISAELIRTTETQCIRVDVKDNLYITDDFIVTHNTPRMAILISGGRVDDSTVEDAKKFFRQGKGREHFGRALILSVSGKNTLAGTKIPTIKIEPIGLGKEDDASFMKYKEVTAQTIREAFQQAGIFLGSTGDSNRASSYTLRDMTVEGVYAAESRDYAHLVNETLVVEFAKEQGIEDLLVKLAFVIPRTMSEKDWKTFKLTEVQAGVTTINDYRTANGMDKIDKWWAELSSKLIVPAMQMSELSPDLVESLTGYSEFEPDDSLEGTTKSLVAIRKALVSLTKQPSHKITKESMEILDDWFKKRWS